MGISEHIHHPAYALAMGPAAEMFASMPKHTVGDVNGRRAILAQKFGAMSQGTVDLPAEVYEKVHQVKSKDGTLINVYQFAPKKNNDPPGPSVL